MIKPLQKNILNGEMLRGYNDINVDLKNSARTNKLPVILPMPQPINNLESENKSINFDDNSNRYCLDANNNISFNEPCLDNQNRVFYRFLPESNFSIHVKPSKSNSLIHHFVNVDDIKFKNALTSSYNNNFNNSCEFHNSLADPGTYHRFPTSSTNNVYKSGGYCNDTSLNTNDLTSSLHFGWSNNDGSQNRLIKNQSQLILMQTEHIEQSKSDYEQVQLESQNDLIKVDQPSQSNKFSKVYFLGSNDRIDALSKSTNNIMGVTGVKSACNSDLSEKTKRKHLNTFKPLDSTDSLSRTSQSQLKSALPVELPIELENKNAKSYECNKTNENFFINYDLSKEQYDSLMKSINRKKKLNITNHQIYLPPAPTIGYDQANHSIINFASDNYNNKSSPESNESQSITATLIHGSVCNCVNIASCSKDKLNGFIHSSDCNLVQANTSSRNLSNTVEFQRMHF